MLPHFVTRVQTHFIYGAEDDYLPKEVKDDILRIVGGKERLGGWARVPDSGHLVSLPYKNKEIYSRFLDPPNEPQRAGREGVRGTRCSENSA